MATVKTTKAAETAEKTEATAQEQFGWDDMVEMTMPRAVAGEAKSWYVAVNGRSYMVPLGKRVEVPYPIYEAVMTALDAADKARDEYEAVPDRQ